jgi:hypothetical protein
MAHTVWGVQALATATAADAASLDLSDITPFGRRAMQIGVIQGPSTH